MAGNGQMTAVVIGAGHNGLTAAAMLAGRGARVTVLERAAGPGGMMAGDGIELAHLVWNLHPAALAAFGVDAGALRLGPPLPTVALDAGGRHVVIEGAEARLSDGAQHPEAEAYRALVARLRRFARVLAPLAAAAPPLLGARWLDRAGIADLAGLARTGLGLRRLGRAEMREFLRIALSNVADVVLDRLADGPLAASLAFDGVLGAKAGPRAPGTVLPLIYRQLQGGERRRPRGGMAVLAQRLAEAAGRRGAAIRYGVEATGLAVERDRVRGVLTAGGETVPADLVLSSLGARPTLMLAGPGHFDAEPCRRIRSIRAEGTAARLDLALSAVPRVAGLDARHLVGRLLLAPSVTAIEGAFNPVKYGRPSPEPVIEALIEAGEAPRVSAVVQYVPHSPPGGWTDDARAALTASVIAAFERHAPGFAGLVRGSTLLTPADIEARTGAPGGHWHHGEFSPDQMLTLRPVNGMARYRTGLPGLYLCGAGAHPGGDITGLPGRNAALAALADGVPAPDAPVDGGAS
ncbi:MAG TPA: NAD(P)/FAD-dependent oxidoreductase [Thermohalobaculum sp.]|nr:NAD(P)/FAD-dependent oxidoreductase [Thermohalobaculum sp.]